MAAILTVRFVRRKDGNHVFLGITNGNDQERAVAVRVRRLLGMTPGQTEAEVIYGSVSSGPHQIAMVCCNRGRLGGRCTRAKPLWYYTDPSRR